LAVLGAWWAEQMRALLPEGLRGPSPDREDALIAEAPSPAGPFTILLRRRRRETALGTFGPDDITPLRAAIRRRGRPPAAILRVPAQSLLEREVPLPAAAEPELDRVIAYEMDRLTPFSADDVFWDAGVVGRDRTRNQLRVRLSLLPRAAVERLLATLEAAGVKAGRIEVGRAGGVRRISLRHEPATRRNAGTRALAMLTAVLAVAAVATPFVMLQRALSEVNGRIDALRPAVTEAEALRRRIAANATGADAIVAERARLGDALGVLATVTEILPDDTFLTEYTYRQRRVVMSGEAAAAAKLIGLLSADPLIRDPSFTAPVTRSETGKSDLFVIRAEIGS
jgi:general secretion pathway protein L